jgi:hypothetical protein
VNQSPVEKLARAFGASIGDIWVWKPVAASSHRDAPDQTNKFPLNTIAGEPDSHAIRE